MECVSTVKVIVKMTPTVIRQLEGVMADVIHIGKDVTAKIVFKDFMEIIVKNSVENVK